MSKNKSITEEALVAILDEKLNPIIQTVNDLNDSVKFLSDKFDNVYKKNESLDKELKDVKSESKHLKSEGLRLSGVVDQHYLYSMRIVACKNDLLFICLSILSNVS